MIGFGSLINGSVVFYFVAEWERRSQSNALRTPSQTRKPVDMGEDHRPGSPTGLGNRSQLTEAQVETYPTRNYAQTGPSAMGSSSVVDHHQAGHLQQDSSRSVSPGGTWSSPYHPSNNSHVREADRVRVRQDGLSSGEWNLLYFLRFLSYIWF